MSQVTEDFPGWLCGRCAAPGKRLFVLAWDNASWHVSKRARRRIAAHDRRVKRDGGCQIRVCGLPVKAVPRPNTTEPKWLHGQRAVVERDRKLTPAEVGQRVRVHYRWEAHELPTKNAALILR